MTRFAGLLRHCVANVRGTWRSALVLWGVAIALLAASDWPLGITSGWSRDHPLSASIAVTLALVAAGAFAFDGWLQEREAARWHRVAQVAYRALSQEAKDTRVKLRLLIDGTDPREEGASADASKVSQLRKLARTRPPEEVDGRVDVRATLRDRSCDDDWLRCALAYLRDMKRDGWGLMTAWGPIMLSQERTTIDLDLMSQINDAVIALQRCVAHQLTLDHADPVGEEIALAMQTVVLRSLQLEEHLRIGAGYTPRNDPMLDSCAYWGVVLDGDEGDRTDPSAPCGRRSSPGGRAVRAAGDGHGAATKP